LRLAALRAERDELYRIARSGTLTNEVTRTLVREIDLQESRFSAGQHCSRSGAARTRSGIHSWRKIEEAKSGCADFLLKLLKRLALLRGNGEHNQKHRQIKRKSVLLLHGRYHRRLPPASQRRTRQEPVCHGANEGPRARHPTAKRTPARRRFDRYAGGCRAHHQFNVIDPPKTPPTLP
jgi:hypothetical protein